MAKVIGVQLRKYTNKQGRAVEGYNLYVTYPRDGVTGLACEGAWCAPASINAASEIVGGIPQLVGQEVTLLYNRWGSVEAVQLVKQSK